MNLAVSVPPLPRGLPDDVYGYAEASPVTRHRVAGTRLHSGTGQRGQPIIADVGQFLAEEVRRSHGRILDPRNSPRDMEAMLRQGVADIHYQLGQPYTGETWYEDSINEAFRLASLASPKMARLARDDHLRNVMTAVMAIHGNKPSPRPNMRNAVRSMEVFLDTGHFPGRNPDNGMGWPTNNPADTARQLLLLEHVIEKEKGIRGASRFLLGLHEPWDLRNYVKDSGIFGRPSAKGWGANPVYGMRIFGPKLAEYGLGMNGLGRARWTSTSRGRTSSPGAAPASSTPRRRRGCGTSRGTNWTRPTSGYGGWARRRAGPRTRRRRLSGAHPAGGE